MKLINRQSNIIAVLIWALAFMTNLNAQTETKCDENDSDCPKVEKESVKADKLAPTTAKFGRSVSIQTIAVRQKSPERQFRLIRQRPMR